MESTENSGKERSYVFDPEGLAALASRFRDIRKKANLTQEQLAFEACVQVSQIKRLEKGSLNTSVSTIFYVARALEIDPEVLFSGIKLTPERDPRKKPDE